MSFDRSLLSEKLKKYREQFRLTISELSQLTGIKDSFLQAYENQEKIPTGDEILILADYYLCDYKFFISNERVAPFEQTETLFRRHGNIFSKEDRRAIQEFLFLAECESFLIQQLGKKQREFVFSKPTNNHKKNGIAAANALRKEIGYTDNEVRLNIYDDFRKIGIHTFRRQLNNSDISGLYIKHPVAGKCILINYDEDIYRQRFTAAHEAAHAILEDDKDGVIVSLKGDQEYVEIGANNFASHYLMPPKFLGSIPNWDEEKALEWANKLKVSTEALAYALSGAKLIDNVTQFRIKSVRVAKEQKVDPELPDNLSPRSLERKQTLLKKGLSDFYVNLCIEGYKRDVISLARMAEMLLVDELELFEILSLFNERICL